jgi:RuvC endonuclease subdomain 3/HNH endonuclease
MNTKSIPDFVNGLVFGFDIGTGSIGYAVRKGTEFKDVGVLICPNETNDLRGRRGLRRQRRTLRSRSYRRKWFARELERLGFPGPVDDGKRDPVKLRAHALAGEILPADELHAAFAHLFRRRGYCEVPWKQATERESDSDVKKEEGEIRQKMSALQAEMNEHGFRFPCELLKWRAEQGRAQRREVWPRELLRGEFLAIIEAQKKNFPALAGDVNGKPVADWLLYGDASELRGHRVFFKSTRNPGVFALRWPRFENRGPALDSLTPLDDEGRPLHVVRKNKSAFVKAQWELAVMNFRVIDRATGKLVAPNAEALARLRAMWEAGRRKSKKKTDAAENTRSDLKISEKVLDKWATEFSERYKLVEGQKPLTPQSGVGRARYSSPTLLRLRAIIDAGQLVDVPQPILRRDGEDNASALGRYLSEVKHPLVRHRLILFRGLLAELIEQFGVPEIIVVEAVRSLALSQKNKNELNKRNEQYRKERKNAREQLITAGESGSRRAIQRFRLWQEAKGRCPFCLKAIARTDLGHGTDIEHLVPRSIVDCNEYYNLTVAHLKCNREIKGERTPFAAFHDSPDWDGIKSNAEQCFRGRKLEIFLSPQAEELVEQRIDIQHTAYIARVLRHVALLELNWLAKDGRDPTPEKQNPALRFQVTNGQLTSRLRKAWGLNQILHPLPPGRRWEDLSEAEHEQMRQKNRRDLRHHALDAMVIACTLPWLAHRTHGATDEYGNHGWWTQDEKQRSKAANPIGLTYDRARAEIERTRVRHHASRSPHQQGYATTLYAKKAPNTYVAREVFTTLTPKNLGSIWPTDFAAYCEAAWARYKEESADVDAQLKKTKGCLPETFTQRLCFSHFQTWRASGAPEFHWPSSVRIPIRSVRLISLKDDTAVAPFSTGTHAFVKRTGFREVHIYPSKDGKSLVPVFIPYWKGDKPISAQPIREGEAPIAILRRGQIVKLKKAVGAKGPPGSYRVVSTMQDKPQIIPSHIARDKKALLAFGYFENGVNVSWPVFLNALGYEPPHPPSAQPKSSTSAEPGPASN